MKNKRIKCADGFSMSVQANSGAYCSPRSDNAASYDEVEVGLKEHYSLVCIFPKTMLENF